MPEGRSTERKSIRDVMIVDSILHEISTNELGRKDAERIIDLLQEKGLLESAVMSGDGPDTQPLLPFLRTFWDYDNSPYVREKLAFLRLPPVAAGTP